MRRAGIPGIPATTTKKFAKQREDGREGEDERNRRGACQQGQELAALKTPLSPAWVISTELPPVSRGMVDLEGGGSRSGSEGTER
jgi:hypothetical protein